MRAGSEPRVVLAQEPASRWVHDTGGQRVGVGCLARACSSDGGRRPGGNQTGSSAPAVTAPWLACGGGDAATLRPRLGARGRQPSRWLVTAQVGATAACWLWLASRMTIDPRRREKRAGAALGVTTVTVFAHWVSSRAGTVRASPSEYPRGTPRRGRDPPSTTALPSARDQSPKFSGTMTFCSRSGVDARKVERLRRHRHVCAPAARVLRSASRRRGLSVRVAAATHQRFRP